MDLHQLRCFVAAADELHFGRAARRMDLMPAAFGRHIQLLEETLGARLFVRTTRSCGRAMTLRPARAVPAACIATTPARRQRAWAKQAAKVLRSAWTGSTAPSSIIWNGASSPPERLSVLLEQLLDRREEWVERRRNHITELNKQATEAEAKLKRLYEAIENGLINMADLSLKNRIVELTAIRDQAQAQADAERAQAAVERTGPKGTLESLKRFSEVARAKLRTETGEYHRDHLRALAQRVEVVSKSEIRLMGNKSDLLRTLAAASSVGAAANGVRSFVPKWRADVDETENYVFAATL